MKVFIAFYIALLFSANVLAEDAGPMWMFPVARLCIGQDPGYRQTVFGRWIMQGRLDFKSPEFDACVREKNWLPRKMCDELMSLDTEDALSSRNLERLRNKYASELRASSLAGEYFAAFYKADSEGSAVPSCPQDTPPHAPPRRVDIFAASNDVSLRAISDSVGAVNEWRLVPSVLLAHCAKEAPQSEPSMRAIYESEHQTNESLLSSIDLC